MGEEMDKTPLNLDDFEFPKTSVNVEEIQKFNNEDQFTALAVELFKEVMQITTLLACTYRLDQDGNPKKWQRNEAILGGLMIRISKLQMAFLDQICQNRMEITNIIDRSLAEGIFNLIYLLKNSSDELFDEYIEYSLRTEKELLNRIRDNIDSRGYELPIETRMIRSIEWVFDISGYPVEQVRGERRNPWGKSIYNRLKDIEMENMYLVYVGLLSHSVHGNWQDLIDNHLEYQDGAFSPKINWCHSRPQPIFAESILSFKANELYLDKIIEESPDKERLKELNNDVMVRISAADELHEQFLNLSNKNV